MSSVYKRVKDLCEALPEVTTRKSHGEDAWFVRKKMFVMTADRHHDDRVALWCAAPLGLQATLVEDDPDRYFVPPYVGHRGWVGVYLDVEVDWDEVAEIIDDAYRSVAPARLAARLTE